MRFTITRLALFQCVVIFYSIVFVGLMVRVRLGSPAPPIFATHLRDYGFLLLILPVAWLIWAGLAVNRPRPDTGDLGPILLTGLALLGVLLLIAIVGTLDVALRPPTARLAPGAPPGTSESP